MTLKERLNADFKEAMKNKQNTVSKEIPKLKKAGEDTTAIMAEMKELSDKIKVLDTEVSQLDADIKNALLNIPNSSSIPYTMPRAGFSREARATIGIWAAVASK